MNENAAPAPPTEGAGGVPSDLPSAFIAAVARQKAGDIAGAIKLYRRIIELDPYSGDAYNNLANLLAGQQQLLAAVACLRRAARLAPRSATVFANLGNYLRLLGRFDEAALTLGRALELDPDSGGTLPLCPTSGRPRRR